MASKKPQYTGPYTQKSEPGNNGHSGLPLKSDGTLRESSNFTIPSEEVNPPEKD